MSILRDEKLSDNISKTSSDKYNLSHATVTFVLLIPSFQDTQRFHLMGNNSLTGLFFHFNVVFLLLNNYLSLHEYQKILLRYNIRREQSQYFVVVLHNCFVAWLKFFTSDTVFQCTRLNCFYPVVSGFEERNQPNDFQVNPF